ncbi:uncharacterized protein LOC127278885 [Leptopilina boulardi]|uniref:uncharacterized protein LOC127278885 n=1 Tax=Leptopilina boulardi TaxID=63433 RepID=UPI0021F52D25|nr:uncharacterized protein LOC127278885 [Leptopilina boulardi]
MSERDRNLEIALSEEENFIAYETIINDNNDQFEIERNTNELFNPCTVNHADQIEKVVELFSDDELECPNMSYAQSDMEDNFLVESSDDDNLSLAEDCEPIENNDFPYRNCFSSIAEVIGNNNMSTPIQVPVKITPSELLLMILKYAIVHALSLIEITNLFKLINCIFAFNVLPNTKYLIDKLFYPKNRTELHATCTKCSAYVGKFKRETKFVKCKSCKTKINTKNYKYKDFFVTMDASSHILKLIECNSTYYKYVVNERINDKGNIRDIYDGKLYRNFVKNLSENDKRSYATVTFNTDGAPLFTSSSYSIWPIFLMVNELPYHIRSKNLILIGLWFGKDKPKMNVFLKPFVQKMKVLSTAGVKCKVGVEEMNIKIFAQVCCCDSVARAPVMGFVQFNGCYGCHQCLHPGEWVLNSRKKRSGIIKYVLTKEKPKSRNNDDTIKHMQSACQSGKSVFGVKQPSQLINLIDFNFIYGCIFDSMHCISGIAKQFATIWFGNKEKGGLFSKTFIPTIDNALNSIKVPNQICRLTRLFSERAFWKAREWENWVLFYSSPILQTILHDDLFKHWTLLVDGIYLLLQDEIKISEIDLADELLHKFVGKTELLYTKRSMTFNVHILLHLSKSVFDWGPLWAHNAFAFESGNGELLKVIHAANGVHHQICRQISLQYSMLFLKDHLYPNCSFKVKDFYDNIGTVRIKKTLQISGIRYFGPSSSVEEKWIIDLNISEKSVSYKKIVKNSCLFMSCLKNNKRSNNSFAILYNGTYVQLFNFVVDPVTKSEYVIVKKIVTVNFIDENCRMIKKIVEIIDNKVAVPSHEIKKVCVYMSLNVNCQYLCSVPNLHLY